MIINHHIIPDDILSDETVVVGDVGGGVVVGDVGGGVVGGGGIRMIFGGQVEPLV